MAMVIVYLARDLSLTPGQIGRFFSNGAIGGILGAILVKPVVRVSAPFALAVPLARPGWSVWVAAACLSVGSVGVVVYNVTQLSFRQGLTPERLLNGMNATMRFLVWGTMPLGGLLGAWFGARRAVFVGVGVACFAFLSVYLSPLRTMREPPGPAPTGKRSPVDAGV